MSVLRAGPADLDRLARIHARAFPQPWTAGDIAALGGAALAEAEAGMILVRTAAGEAEVLTVAVVPEARGRGLGRRLVEAGLDAARQAGADLIFLEVAEDNAPARRLYAACGFSETGRRPGYYHRPGEPAVDALVMSRALNTGP